MGRTLLTATLQVQKFENDWKRFTLAPRKLDREAFAELCAFAHFRAAPIAHAASPYMFEMILLTMLVGLVRRVETLEQQGIMQFYAEPATSAESAPPFQPALLTIMTAVRQRLAKQNHELYTFARALRRRDQQALRALLNLTRAENALVPVNGNAPSDEMLLTTLVCIMRRIRQIEKQHENYANGEIAGEWSALCASS
jgi:hypothetical protein